MKHILRRSLYRVIKGCGGNGVSQYLGCSLEKFISWMEFQFYDGICWENYGSYWHIDHTIPVSSFNFENEEVVYKCYNWINLRPLKAHKNLSKSNKINMIDYLFQEIKAFKFSKLYEDATPSNSGNLLRASDTTSSEKSNEGTRVTTEPNGNNSEDDFSFSENEMDNPDLIP